MHGKMGKMPRHVIAKTFIQKNMHSAYQAFEEPSCGNRKVPPVLVDQEGMLTETLVGKRQFPSA